MRPASPMTMPRTSKAVRDPSGVQARLLPNPFLPPGIMPLTTHNKRCPKALRLSLRSDLSPSSPSHGRSPENLRHALRKGRCQVRAPLTRRKVFAAPGDAPEHGVTSLHWAIAPFSDSPAAYHAGESEQSDERRLKTNAPSSDSTVAYLAGESEQSDERRLKTNAPSSDSPAAYLAGESEQSDERRLKTNAPFLDSTVVTTGELPTTNAGLGSPLLSLGMVEHFRWSRLPHRESFSRLLHILSEVWGCRRVDADANRPQGRTPCIGTGVADFMHKRPEPSNPTLKTHLYPSFLRRQEPRQTLLRLNPTPQSSLDPLPSIELEAEAGASTPASASVLPSPSPLMRPLHNRHHDAPRRIWGSALSSAPSPLIRHSRAVGNLSPVRVVPGVGSLMLSPVEV